jgi:hypothetical protein
MKNCPLSALRDTQMLLSRLSHHIRLETVQQQYEKCRQLITELRRRFPENDAICDSLFAEVRNCIESKDASGAQLLLLRDIDHIRTSVMQDA